MSAFGVASTLALIDEFIKENAKPAWRSAGISMSAMGKECLRATYYDFRWVNGPEDFDARMLRLFDTGERYEERLLDWLEGAGIDVQRFDDDTGKQIKVVLAGGFLRGKLDGRCFGLPEAPETSHVVECKSHGKKSFEKLLKETVKVAKFEHYIQMQLYMHAVGDTHALYMAVQKDNDQIYLERVAYDPELCLRMIGKAEYVASADVPPPKIAERPTMPACKWCDHKDICHGSAFPKGLNCRTCVFSRTVFDGKGSWECTRQNKPLSYNEQVTGCDAHLFIPELIPGEVVTFDEENHRVDYKLRDGREWSDGNVKRSL